MAGFNLSSFRQRVHGFAKQQYFLVRIPQIGDSETVTALARSASLPEVKQSVSNVPYRGLPIKISKAAEFSDWQVDFICDEAHVVRNMFIKWMELQYDVLTLQNKAHNDYKVDNISVSQLSADLQVTTTARFDGMFPVNVGKVDFKHEASDPQVVSVTFAYDYMVMNDLAGNVIDADSFIQIDDTGRFSGVTIDGIAGVTLNLPS